jgi:hypothetical protein
VFTLWYLRPPSLHARYQSPPPPPPLSRPRPCPRPPPPPRPCPPVHHLLSRDLEPEGVTKRCRLSLLTNSALVCESQYGGMGGLRFNSLRQTRCLAHHSVWAQLLFSGEWVSDGLAKLRTDLLLFCFPLKHGNKVFHV